jgi:hypothetical protein
MNQTPGIDGHCGSGAPWRFNPGFHQYTCQRIPLGRFTWAPKTEPGNKKWGIDSRVQGYVAYRRGSTLRYAESREMDCESRSIHCYGRSAFMNRLLVALVILLFLEIDVAWACSGRIEGGIDYADLELQEALVQELAATAETIALVQVVQVDYEVPKLDVRTREVIKGTLDQRVELTWEGYDRYACKPSASFHNIRVTEGKEYFITKPSTGRGVTFGPAKPGWFCGRAG